LARPKVTPENAGTDRWCRGARWVRSLHALQPRAPAFRQPLVELGIAVAPATRTRERHLHPVDTASGPGHARSRQVARTGRIELRSLPGEQQRLLGSRAPEEDRRQ